MLKKFMKIWISKDHMREAEDLMKEWEKQGCTYAEIEMKIAALNRYFSDCKDQIANEPFKTLKNN